MRRKAMRFRQTGIGLFLLGLLSSPFFSSAQVNTAYNTQFTSSTFVKTVDLLKPVGTVKGKHDVSGTGAATYTIPIILPPATNGHKPEIAMSYNSQGGNGIGGFGWSIDGLSTISRANRNWYNDGNVSAIQNNVNDAYIVDGIRIVPTSGANGANGTIYATENESYSQIISYGANANGPDWFKVTMKNGMVYEYGNSTSSKVNNSGQWVYWRVNKVTDVSGNYYEFIYDNADNDSRVSEINFTGNQNTGMLPYSKMSFAYSARSDQNTVYDAGLSYNQKYLLDRITVTAEGNVAFKIYDFKYAYDNIYSFLQEVIETGSDNTQLNSTIFKYGDKPTDMVESTYSFLNGTANDRFSGDFDGDGYTDLLAAGYAYSSGIKFNTNFRVWKRTASSSTFFNSYASATLPGNLQINGQPFTNYNIAPSDFNGDGRDDILFGKASIPSSGCRTLDYIRIYSPDNTASNFTFQDYGPPVVTSGFPTGTFTCIWPNSSNYYLGGDFNGDGISDFLTFLSNGTGYKIFYTRPNVANGNNNIVTNPYAGNPNYDGHELATPDANYPIDFNGDGKTDIMSIKDGTCKIYEVIPNPGGPNPFKLNLLHSTGYPTKWHNIWFGDFNGDGKTDILTINNTGIKEIAYSTGKGWDAKPFVFNNAVTMSLPQVYSDDKILVADYNGDGKADIAHCYTFMQGGVGSTSKINIYYSRGNSFYYQQYNHSTVFGFSQPVAVDFNGDGRSEIINYTSVNSSFYTLQIKPNGRENLLERITDGSNATIRFNYLPLTSAGSFYVRGNGGNSSYPLNTVQNPYYNVSSVVTPDGNGGTNTISYRYEEARAHRAGRGFLGFTTITADDNKTNIRTVVKHEFDPTYFVPARKSITTYQLSTNTLLATTTNTNVFQALPGNRFSYRTSAISEVDHLQNITKTTTHSFDSYDNITSRSTTNGVETEVVNTTYGQFNTTVPCVPTYVTITKTRSGQPSVTTNTQYNYNATGLLTSRVDYHGLPNAVTTSYTYNSFGNRTQEVLSATGMASRTINFNFDAKGRYMTFKEKLCASCGSAVSQKEYFNNSKLWGTLLNHTSSDCQYTSHTYDGFGRILTTTLPTGVTITSSYGWDINNGLVTYRLTQHPGKPDEKIWFDLLGRERKAMKELMNGQWSTTLSSYNNKGLLVSKSNMHIAGTETPINTTYTYDAFNRKLTESNPLNTYSYTYTYNTGNSTLVTEKVDLAGKFHRTTTDASGKITRTDDAGGNVTFIYDSWGNQRFIRQNGATVATRVFNQYNKVVSNTEVNAGTVNYTYDAFGQTITQTDANGNMYTYAYDNLGRMTTRTGPEGTTTYQYYCRAESPIAVDPQPLDPSPAGPAPGGLSPAGALEARAIGPVQIPVTYCCNDNIVKIIGFNGIVQDFKYDVYGRLIQKDETIDNIVHSTKYSFDANDNNTSITYPSNLVVLNTFDANGYLLTTSRQGGGTLYTTNSINGMGQITQYTLGNGKVTTHTYSNGFPLSFVTPTVQSLGFTWNTQSGNLTQRRDVLKSLTEDFTYDNLNRLTTAQVVGQPVQFYGFDPYPNTGNSRGNIKAKTDAGFYRYTNPKFHAQSSIANLVNTNQPPANISANTQTISYTGFLRPNIIAENGYQQEFTYSPAYDRMKSVMKFNNVVTETRYYFGDYEKQIIGANTNQIHYISGANGICAVIVMDGVNTNTYYTYNDHLGSPLTITNAAGTVISEQNFDAWGRRRNPNNWTYASVPAPLTWLYRGYTSHEEMPQFGLINMNARLYDPVTGKMISPDNFINNPFASQDYNRYAYANNNPLAYIDPDGNHPILVALLIYGLFFTETGYKVQKVFSPVALHVSVNFGSNKRGIGVDLSVGVPQIIPISYRVHGGISYNWRNYDVGRGWEKRSGSEWGIGFGGFGASYSSTKYNSPGTKFDQTTGSFGLYGWGGLVNLQYENDWQPEIFSKLPFMYDADGGDRYRTAAMRLNIGLFSVGFNLFTGDPGLDGSIRQVDPTQGNATGTYITSLNGDNPDEYRHGVLYIGFGPLKIGMNTEGIRHAIQNRFAHDTMQKGNTAWFKRLDGQFKPRFFWNFGSGSGNGLW